MDRFRPGSALAPLFGCFGLFGVTIGTQGVVWAELMAALRLSEGAFGSAQLVSPLVSVGLMLAAGPLSVRAGKKRLAVASLALLASAAAALAGAGGLRGFVGALFVLGLGNGLLEIAVNGAVLDWERATGRAVMNVMHAGFSGGAVLGAFGAGALLESGAGYGRILALLAGLCGLGLVATLPIGYPPEDSRAGLDAGLGSALSLVLGRRALVGLALLGILGILGESVANTWSVIYLRQLGAQALVGGAAFALFNGAMCVGRLLNAPIVARVGPRASLLASGAGLVASGLLLTVPGSLWLAVAAFVLLGLAVAGVVPTVLSAAAGVAPGQSGAVAGGIMAAAYLGFVLCPPLIGWLAEAVSLRGALLSVGLAGVAVVWLARAVGASPSAVRA